MSLVVSNFIIACFLGKIKASIIPGKCAFLTLLRKEKMTIALGLHLFREKLQLYQSLVLKYTFTMQYLKAKRYRFSSIYKQSKSTPRNSTSINDTKKRALLYNINELRR